MRLHSHQLGGVCFVHAHMLVYLHSGVVDELAELRGVRVQSENYIEYQMDC